MSDAAFSAPAPATPPAAPTHRPTRHAHDAAATTRRWAVGVLVVATLLLVGAVALLLAMGWFLMEAWTGEVHDKAADLLAAARYLAPTLLVGWCVGLAASAVLARGQAIGPRLAGVAAGALGTAAGAAVLALTGNLL